LCGFVLLLLLPLLLLPLLLCVAVVLVAGETWLLVLSSL
jgi:hypothetical protein